MRLNAGCLRNTGVDADGSGFAASGPKADPREREIDALFMARDYKKDAAGRFIRQPPPMGMMHPRIHNDQTSEVKKVFPSLRASAVKILMQWRCRAIISRSPTWRS